MSKTNATHKVYRPKTEFVFMSTRIPLEDYHLLVELAKIKLTDSRLPSFNKYELTKFAVLQMLKALRKQNQFSTSD